MRSRYITIQNWMRDDLGLAGNELIVYSVIYGFSQDGESEFHGSRQYLADWCGCSVRQIQNILNDLVERGLLAKREEFVNGEKRCYYSSEKIAHPSEKISRGSSEKISLGGEKISQYNLANKQDEDITINSNISEQTEFDSHMYSPSDFLGSSKKRKRKTTAPKKPTLYDKCKESINLFTTDAILQDMLSKFLQIRLQIKDKPLYGVEQWNALLSKLTELSSDNYVQRDIVKRSIESGWASFYPLKTASCNKSKDVVTSEYGKVHCDKNDSEDSVDEAF